VNTKRSYYTRPQRKLLALPTLHCANRMQSDWEVKLFQEN
jgi:hypothetical protein